MAVSAEQLNIILSARDKEFAKAMERNQRRVERFANKSQKDLTRTGNKFNVVAAAAKKLLPALAAGVVIGQMRRITAEMDEIGKKADQIGLTTDALQELRFVAEGAGVSQQKFTSSLERFSKRLGEAEMGAGAAKKALEELNLKASDLTAIPLDDALGVVADKMASIESPTERAALAAALFGREGVAMVNMLRGGSSALDDMRKAASDAGAVIDEDLIRNAEEAQTRIDAAARVINAQLSVALAELIPLLVTGAEGFAALVKNVVGAIQAVQAFLDPQTDLEIATDNVVAAMGDEIRQSQQLAIALGRTTQMTEASAKAELEDAKARYENINSILAKNSALALGSDAYQSLIDQIKVTEDAARGISVAPDTLLSSSKIAAYEAVEQKLVELRNEQTRMLTADQELTDQFTRTTENIALLEESLANASNGMVVFGEDMASPIEASDRLSASASRAAASTDELLANLATASPALQSLGFDAENLESTMSTVEASMEDAFMSMIDGTQSAGDAFKSMASEIIKELFRVLVVQQLVGSFSSGGGGILGSVFGAIGGGAAPITGQASGGSVQAGKPYITGEHGRELFVPQVNGRILSAGQTNNAMSSGGGGVTVIQNNTFGSGVSRAEVNAMLPKMVEATKAAVADAKLRGGSYGRSFG